MYEPIESVIIPHLNGEKTGVENIALSQVGNLEPVLNVSV